MRQSTIVGLILASLAPAGVASALEPPVPPEAKALFRTHCQRCHGADGKAVESYAKKGTPDLDDADWQAMRSDAEIRKAIADGSEGTLMEGFKDTLKPAEIDALVRYIRNWKKPQG
jgi:mono/diheme cytochrome c family protein